MKHNCCTAAICCCPYFTEELEEEAGPAAGRFISTNSIGTQHVDEGRNNPLDTSPLFGVAVST